MRSIHKSKWVPLAIALTLPVALAGCGGSNNSSSPSNSSSATATASASASPTAQASASADNGKKATVHFTNFSASGDNEKYLTQMKEEFEKQHSNVKVEIETIPYADYFTQMQTRVAAGSAPDAYELNFENFYAYAKKGVLLPLDSLFSSTGFDASVLNKNALDAFKSDGQQYGMPGSFSDVVLIYNKDLFDKAKIAYPTDSWTWKEMDEAGTKIRALGKDIFGVYEPIQFTEFYKVVQQNGGSLLNADKTAFTINSPANVEALQHLQDRIVKSNIMPTEAQLSGMGDWDLFKSGKLGMIVTGIWAFSDFAKNVSFNWDVAVEPGNVKKATHFFSNGLVINKDSKAADAAFQWIEFLSASKEAAKIRIDAGWELPAINDADILKTYLTATPPQNRQAVFGSLQYLVTPPVIEQFSEMSDIVGNHLKEAADGSKTPAAALDAAQKELEQKIKLK